MQKLNPLFFGEFVRRLRKEEELPLRKVAARLDIDPSTLGKIERSQRKPNNEIIQRMSKIFKVSKKELLIKSVSDKIAFEIADKDYCIEVLKESRKKIEYIRKSKNIKS